MQDNKDLIQAVAAEGAKQTMQALAVAQQMGMVNSETELTVLLAASMETVIEEYISRVENQSNIILDETGGVRGDSQNN